MEESKETKDWLEGLGKKFLHSIGMREGQKVVDFGCGIGDYTIPAAKIVGARGKIYAVDKDEESLKFLMSRAKRYGLENIKVMKTLGELKIGLKDESMDIVLLYDIIHDSYFPGANKRKKLLNEIYRILKQNAIVSIYPKHATPGDTKREVKSAHFRFEKEFHSSLLHDSYLVEGNVLNFRRKNDS